MLFDLSDPGNLRIEATRYLKDFVINLPFGDVDFVNNDPKAPAVGHLKPWFQRQFCIMPMGKAYPDTEAGETSWHYRIEAKNEKGDTIQYLRLELIKAPPSNGIAWSVRVTGGENYEAADQGFTFKLSLPNYTPPGQHIPNLQPIRPSSWERLGVEDYP